MATKYTSKPIPVKLDEELLKRIEQMAERMGEAKSTVMRIAMRVGLENLEAAFQAEPDKTLSSLTSRSEHNTLNERDEKKKKASS